MSPETRGCTGSPPHRGMEIEEPIHESREMWQHGSPPRRGIEIEDLTTDSGTHGSTGVDHGSGDTWWHRSPPHRGTER
jgi:hypothetical protein